jgi:hypothetical protein
MRSTTECRHCRGLCAGAAERCHHCGKWVRRPDFFPTGRTAQRLH